MNGNRLKKLEQRLKPRRYPPYRRIITVHDGEPEPASVPEGTLVVKLRVVSATRDEHAAEQARGTQPR